MSERLGSSASASVSHADTLWTSPERSGPEQVSVDSHLQNSAPYTESARNGESLAEETKGWYELKALETKFKPRFIQDVADHHRDQPTLEQQTARSLQLPADEVVNREQEITMQPNMDTLVACEFTDKKLQNVEERMRKIESILKSIHGLNMKTKKAIGELQETFTQIEESLSLLRIQNQDVGQRESKGIAAKLWPLSFRAERASKDDQQRYREQIATLKQENASLEKRLQRMTREMNNLEETNKRLISTVLIKKGEVEGSFTSGNETPAAIAEEYENLFSHGRRNLVRVKKWNDIQAKAIVNKMFKRAYEECRQAVLQEMFQELFCHHVPDMEQSAFKEIKAQYGRLLHLKKPCILDNVDTRKLALKVVNDVLRKPSSDLPEHDPIYIFALNAVRIALKMVTIQPPMVIDYPSEFNDDVHTKQASQWCEEYQGKTDLTYFRPVLYSTSEQIEPIKKGQVGNQPCWYVNRR